MQPADFQRFKSVMTGMAKVYERELDGVLLDAYWLTLRGWSLPEFEAAAAHLMSTSEFMPRPAAFHALRQAARPTPGEAWARVLRHVRTGAYRQGGLRDDTVESAVRALGGYRAIAMSHEERLPFLERRFSEHYATKADVEVIREALPQLVAPGDRLMLKAPETVPESIETDAELSGVGGWQ
jgi:hypothetical protein